MTTVIKQLHELLFHTFTSSPHVQEEEAEAQAEVRRVEAARGAEGFAEASLQLEQARS